LPDNAWLLGGFNPSLPLALPKQTGTTSGMLVLYSLADQAIIDFSKQFVPK